MHTKINFPFHQKTTGVSHLQLGCPIIWKIPFQFISWVVFHGVHFIMFHNLKTRNNRCHFCPDAMGMLQSWTTLKETIRYGGPGWGQDSQTDVQKHVCKLASGNGGTTFSLGHSIHQFPSDRMRKANMPDCQGHSKSIFLHTSATHATSSKRSMSARKEGKCPLP